MLWKLWIWYIPGKSSSRNCLWVWSRSSFASLVSPSKQIEAHSQGFAGQACGRPVCACFPGWIIKGWAWDGELSKTKTILVLAFPRLPQPWLHFQAYKRGEGRALLSLSMLTHRAQHGHYCIVFQFPPETSWQACSKAASLLLVWLMFFHSTELIKKTFLVLTLSPSGCKIPHWLRNFQWQEGFASYHFSVQGEINKPRFITTSVS